VPEPFPAKRKLVCREKTPALEEDDAAMTPGSRNDASSHFLTVGTRCGNSPRRLKGLVQDKLERGFRGAAVRMIPAEPRFP
jgi:hypothetical protein